MPERDGKDQGEDSPKEAGLCWFARHSWSATSGANLYPPGGCCVVFLWRYVCIVLFLFRIFLFDWMKPLPLVQPFFVFRDACAPRAPTQLSNNCLRPFSFFFFLFFVSLEMSLFPSIFRQLLGFRCLASIGLGCLGSGSGVWHRARVFGIGLRVFGIGLRCLGLGSSFGESESSVTLTSPTREQPLILQQQKQSYSIGVFI